MQSAAEPTPPRIQQYGGAEQAADEQWDVPSGPGSALVSAEAAVRYSQPTRQETMAFDIGLITEIRSEPGARVSTRVEASSGE